MRNREIYKEAKDLGICKEWATRLKNASEKQMAKMFFTGSDWAFENNFPTIELLEKHPNAMKYGLHLDADHETFDGLEHLAFFGKSTANVLLHNFEVAEVFVRHNSEIFIDAKNHAIVDVMLEDNARIEVQKDDTARVSVWVYSENAQALGNMTKKTHCKYEL